MMSVLCFIMSKQRCWIWILFSWKLLCCNAWVNDQIYK